MASPLRLGAKVAGSESKCRGEAVPRPRHGQPAGCPTTSSKPHEREIRFFPVTDAAVTPGGIGSLAGAWLASRLGPWPPRSFSRRHEPPPE